MDDVFAIVAYNEEQVTRNEATTLVNSLQHAYHEEMELECEDTSLPFKYLSSQVIANNSAFNVSYYNRNYMHLVG